MSTSGRRCDRAASRGFKTAALWLLSVAAGPSLAQVEEDVDCSALRRWIVEAARAGATSPPAVAAPRQMDPRVWQVLQTLTDDRHFEPVFRTPYAQMAPSRLSHLSATVVPACERQGALNAQQAKVAAAVLSDRTRSALLSVRPGASAGLAPERPVMAAPGQASPSARIEALQAARRPPLAVTQDQPPAQAVSAASQGGVPLRVQGRYQTDVGRVLQQVKTVEDLEAGWRGPARTLSLPRVHDGVTLPAGQMLECDYVIGGELKATLRFWFRQAPPVGIAYGRRQDYPLELMGLWDAVAHECPATLRTAFQQLDEEDAVLAYIDRDNPNSERQQLTRRFNAGQAPLEPFPDDSFKRAFAAARAERGRDPATLELLRRRVEALENQAASIGGEAFSREVRRLLPLVQAVHAAALVDLPDPKTQGPAAYAAWERRYARPLASALSVLLGVRHVRADASLGMRPGGMNVPHQGFDSSLDMELAVPLQELFRAQLTWFEHHALTDRAWMARAAGTRATQGAAAAAERNQRKDRNDRAIDASAAALNGGRRSRTLVFEGTPGQVAAGIMVHQAAETAGNVVRFVALFNQAVHQRIEGERQLAASLQAFWRCYEARCEQGAQRLADYWSRLTVRDAFDLKLKRGLGSSAYPAVGSWTSGFHERHAATQQLCGHAYAAVMRDYHGSNGYGTQDEGERIRRMATSAEAQPWFACRDQVEFLLRPAGLP